MKKIILTLAFISTVSCIKVPVIERNPVINNPGNETSQNTEKDINLEFNSDKWWQSLNDDNLNAIVDLVLENNKSAVISKLNIDKASEAINLAKSGQGLSVGLGANYSGIMTDSQGQRQITDEKFSRLGQIGLQSSYDVDLFGKTSNLIKQQEFQLEGATLMSKYTELTLAYQTTKLYSYWLFLSKEESNLNNRRKILLEIENMEKNKIKIGKGTKDTLLVIQELVDNTDILVQKNQENQLVTKNSMSNLVGKVKSQEIDSLLEKSKGKDFYALSDNISIPQGINSDIVAQRPDVAYYLTVINGQDAKLKSLKANFYPSFSITGSAQLSQINLLGLVTGGSFLGMLKPSITLPILDSGKITSSYKIAGVDLNIFIEQYNQSIVNAYKDINEKLIKYNSESRINKESKDILGIKSEVLSRSKKRYEIGKTARRSYVEDNYTYLVSVLTSEQEKFALLNYKIDLINAFGGLYTTNQK
ncbi:MAG: TolC family protein [Leptotrichiaceae bacterium]|nr:TolC family protein [Leptotrichiaceae bacterium]MBP6167478.1 TolC family protein [Leptotrichiaceae bacterium]MBP7025855.1 TolC family protein [Leptotrichiaceae bacterium]MBP8636872.1 TolC family protein [Leptotrichiaceae bacterium]MBP9538478.1 TolC family protein [Leptotrichiaceae bacterium]